MLDDSFEVSAGNRKEYPVMPAGIYQCEILDIEKRVEATPWSKGEALPLIKVTLVVLKEGPYYGRKLWLNSMNPVLSPPPKQSKLHEFLAVMNGRGATREECNNAKEIAGKDALNAFVGRQLIAIVKVKDRQGGGQTNAVESVAPIEAALPPFDPTKE